MLLLALGGPATPAAGAQAGAEALLSGHAPPDLKRQLVKHRDRLMQGVADAVAADDASRDAAARRAAAVRGARAIAQRIREHAKFGDIAYEIGGLVHECAAIEGLPGTAPRQSTFAGFPKDPFRDPEALLSVRVGSDRWEAALTRATRLMTWLWKSAGGDASLAARLPESKGPYVVRE
jgi:hypothetical protein